MLHKWKPQVLLQSIKLVYQVQPWEWNGYSQTVSDLRTSQVFRQTLLPPLCGGTPGTAALHWAGFPARREEWGQLQRWWGHFLGVWLSMGCRLSSSADSDPRVKPPTSRVQGLLLRPTGSLGLGAPSLQRENEGLGLQSQASSSPRQAEPWSLAPVTSPLAC